MNISSKPPPRTPGSTRTLTQTDEIEALASAVRLDLLAALRSGPQASVAELAERLQRKPTALYHHLRRLCAAGLVQVAGTRRSGRREETLYALAAPQIATAAAARRSAAGRRGMSQVGRALLRQLARDYERALLATDTVLDGETRSAALALLSLRLDPPQLARFNRELDALLLRWAGVEPHPEGRALRLAVVMAPTR